jgi:site-specific recombinase XerC
MDAGTETVRCPWNKDKLVGQKLPLNAKDIWAVRFRQQPEHRTRDLAMFNLGIDSKLRRCDLVTIRVRNVAQGGRVCARAIVMQRKTQRPVKCEITEQTRDTIGAWVAAVGLDPHSYGTHSMRRIKATLIYRRTRNLRAVQLLLGHTKIESAVRCLGVEVDDALEIAKQTDV